MDRRTLAHGAGLEGTDQLDYPGIIFRGPAHDRRAALAAGPDVWEVVARLQKLEGGEEQRISLLAAESDLHPRLIRAALDYAAEHSGEIRERIDRNRGMTERSRRMAATARAQGRAVVTENVADFASDATSPPHRCDCSRWPDDIGVAMVGL